MISDKKVLNKKSCISHLMVYYVNIPRSFRFRKKHPRSFEKKKQEIKFQNLMT